MQIEEKCHKCHQKTFSIQLSASFVLTMLKIIVGLSGNSKSLIASALHSLMNVVTSFAVYICRKFTHRSMDDDHPYGYGKTEFLVAAVVSAFIILATIALVIQSVQHLIHIVSPRPPHLYTIVVAVISILSNELLFRYLSCVGTKFNSATIITSSWGVRSDSLTSVAVIISVVGANMGWVHFDVITALIVGIVIIAGSGRCFFHAVGGLMDRAVTGEQREMIIQAAESVHRVKVRDLRARFVGPKIWANINIEVMGDYTVEEFDRIAFDVKKKVLELNSSVENALVGYKLC
ncbi:MAG: cation transporter [Oligoflexales bacterium]|nr:cation transporter [Oligoflexales bacterium]